MTALADTLPLALGPVQALGHVVFTEGLLNLNIVGYRSKSRQANRFDDRLEVTYRDVVDNRPTWVTKTWAITTDPGLTYLLHPSRTAGCAILLPGQYRGSHVIGMHRRHYAALVQDRPMRFVRDSNRNSIVDLDDPELVAGEGVLGINIHAADDNPFDAHDPTRVEVGPWSAGCQVFRSSVGYRAFWGLVVRASHVWGKRFTYTLIEES